jgi:ketosteroid isomerase-like protein
MDQAVSELADSDRLDRAAIRGTIEEYFNALDGRDFARLGACFTEDARAEYDAGDGAQQLAGRDEIVARIRGIESCPASTHSLSSTTLELDRDTARADTFAVAVLLLGPNDGGSILVRGLRYEDVLVRARAGWSIASRVHRPLWQYEARSLPCGVPVA